MADKKISALTAATTPLAGTEVLPIVQSSTTKKVTVADLTAGRSFTSTGYESKGDITVKNGTGFTTGSSVVQKWSAYAGSINQFEIAAIEFSTAPFVDGGEIIFKTNNYSGLAEAFRINLAGNIALAAGKGIDFSADPSAAGMTSELLDDYEEGTWTPAFDQFTVGNGSVTGRYTKIGRVVTVIANLTFGSTSSWAGVCTAISNLPFTSAARSVGLISFFKAGTGWYSGQTVLNSGVANTVYPGRYDNTSINATSPFTWAATDYLVLQMTYEA